jgi:hypothetical protein
MTKPEVCLSKAPSEIQTKKLFSNSSKVAKTSNSKPNTAVQNFFEMKDSDISNAIPSSKHAEDPATNPPKNISFFKKKEVTVKESDSSKMQVNKPQEGVVSELPPSAAKENISSKSSTNIAEFDDEEWDDGSVYKTCKENLKKRRKVYEDGDDHDLPETEPALQGIDYFSSSKVSSLSL